MNKYGVKCGTSLRLWEFHKSKEAIDLISIIVDQIVVSDKFKHNNKGFKYFIGYQEGGIVKPLYIILPQMSGYIKYFESSGKNLSFLCLHCLHNYWFCFENRSNNHPRVYLEECKSKLKQIQMSKFISNELKSDSDSDSELDSEKESKFDAELITKLKSGSDSE